MRAPKLAKYVDAGMADEQRAWLDRQRARQARATAEAQEVLDLAAESAYWSHPDGCRSPLSDELAYPVCAHGLRARLIGREGDGFVA